MEHEHLLEGDNRPVNSEVRRLRAEVARLREMTREQSQTILELRVQRDMYEKLALHDALTGLQSLHAFQSTASKKLALARRSSDTFAMLIIDLTGLGEINNKGGLSEGDKALRAVAGAITESIRQSDTAYRLHGDEFAVLLPKVHPPETVYQVAKRIYNAVTSDKVGQMVAIGCSVAREGDTIKMLHDRAGIQMSSAKHIVKRLRRGDSSELPIVFR